MKITNIKTYVLQAHLGDHAFGWSQRVGNRRQTAICVVETDAPWLAPVPRRGETNEPAFVRHTAEALAGIWGISLTEAASITSANARRFFGFPDS